MSQQIPTQNTQLKLDFNIDFTLFYESIRSNFVLIWDNLIKQSQQIQFLKTAHVMKETHPMLKQDGIKCQSRGQNRKMYNNVSLTYSEASLIIEPEQNGIRNEQLNINPQNQLSSVHQLPSVIESDAKQLAKQQKQINKKSNMNPSHSQIIEIGKPKQSNLDQPTQNIIESSENMNHYPNPNNPNSYGAQPNDNNEIMSLIEKNICQINERLEKLQLGSVKENSNFSKKMNQIYNQVQKNTDVMNKKEGQFKKLQFIIQKLRGELSQFKLRKQAQLMKMTNGGNNGSNSKNQFFDLILQKIQQISNIIPQLMLKIDFEDYKIQSQLQFNKLERKMNEKVSQQQFEGLVNVLNRKKPQGHIIGSAIVKKQVKNNKTNQQDKKQQIEIDDEISPIVQFKLISIQKQIKEIQQYISADKQQKQRKLSKIGEKLKQNGAKIQNALKQISRSQLKASEYEQFMRSMNESYNQKFKQVINQIAETQQQIDKLTNQVKFINYTKPEPGSSNPNPSSEPGQNLDMGKLTDLQNEINTLKKKINKLALKSQSFKQQILTVRQDFAKDVDVLKVTLQKKCDWESLKKGMHHFEERVKQISNYVMILQQSLNDPAESNESTAAKKGWTCLCCDKDIKQYEGKLGQIKFTSIFPTRYESPRIGGYYKQKQGEKEYKQVFLKHNRRLSQQKSKDQLNL